MVETPIDSGNVKRWLVGRRKKSRGMTKSARGGIRACNVLVRSCRHIVHPGVLPCVASEPRRTGLPGARRARCPIAVRTAVKYVPLCRPSEYPGVA